MKQINFTFDRHHPIIQKDGKEIARFMPNWICYKPFLFECDNFYHLVELLDSTKDVVFMYDKYAKTNDNSLWSGPIMPHLEHRCYSRYRLKYKRLSHPSPKTLYDVLNIKADLALSIFDEYTTKRTDLIG